MSETISLITIPKTGTHLLARCIELLTEKKEISYSNSFNIENDFFYYHLPYNKLNSDRFAEFSKQKKIYKFFTIRDPRDAIVSFVYWGLQHNTRSTWRNYKDLSFDEILLSLICFGESWYSWKGDQLCSGIKNYYQSYLGWLEDKNHNFCSIRFENLVGINGGGSKTLQIKEIEKIVNFLELQVSSEKIKKVRNELFGKSYTFREGKIGSWKNHFKEIHKEAFKKIAGHLLIDLGYEKDFNW